MQKTKFQIKGMHCNSCALLIEERLKSHPGIIKAKTSYDSQKTVVIYDEQKIQEPEIIQIIKEAGDYQIEKIEEKEEGSSNLKDKECRLPSESSSPISLKTLTGLIIISLGLSISSLIVSSKSLSQKEGQNSGKLEAAIGQNVPSPIQGGAVKQVFEINTSDHIRGNVNAPITLVEFSDFECPFCERHYPTLNKILSDYDGQVRLVYKHFPLGFHPNAQKAAESSECAAEQGKFWEYHDKLFENQPTGYGLEKFKQWARDLGLNTTAFNDCLDSAKFAQKVQADYQEGQQKGVSGTPATFVNGQLVSGALPYETFKQIIDGLVAK